jgi:hypothetical protein
VGDLTNFPVPEQKASPADVPPAGPRPTPKEIFEFVSKHLLLVTSLAIVLGVTAATAGIGAYLRVFDWRLVWVIEYADVLKWGLVAIGVMSAFISLGWAMIDVVDDAVKANWRGIKIVGGIWVISFAGTLLANYLSAAADDHHLIVSGHMIVFFLLATAITVALIVQRGFEMRLVLGGF